MKRVSIAALVCGIVFGILSTWLGPKMIAYWYTPPVPTAFNCTEPITWALHRLVWTQIIGTLIGLAVGVVLGVLMRRREAPPPAAPASKPA
jgi:small basic protein